MTICIQKKLFNLEKIISDLRENKPNVGAIVSFIGYVRDFNKDINTKKLKHMNLEHYPGMTEKTLINIELNAKSKWSLEDVFIIHRVGKLLPSDPIVAVVVASQHRKNAFEACEFIIDFLKTDAPFWKKEISDQDELWVENKLEDHQKKASWNIR
ncbi:molybdenum cofactor biosynthesis protein MoaE [Methylophilaceae bacterium]|jgi:molybdopterin synthase catalytic subunit|nr:molybdenum cofactor biosynthesis protein MoaE [Methylophilaceae bacterium]|tara:strand:+ start:421 stop:885 length:465 start_codon:yes stop_codon:yes gene_type:complete